MLINEKTWDFIRKHAEDNVKTLALKGVKDADVDLTMALQQIAGRQTARRKLPSWAEVEGVVYPPHLNLEQCSSEQTARYKAKIAGEGDSMVDLTGGFGVDFCWMSQGFQHRQYVEQNEALCAISSENFQLLGLACSVSCCDTATFLTEMEPANLIYLDPARRNEHGGRTYGIEDCSPNVLELLPLLLSKADRVMLKLSPMLDWRKAVEDIQKVKNSTQEPIANVHEVHIVSVDNECKELLMVLSKEHTDNLHLVCVNNDSVFDIVRTGRTESSLTSDCESAHLGLGVRSCRTTNGQGEHRWPPYLYEPNASIMKAGCFAELEARFAVQQISANSHLFLSDHEIKEFPGRSFQILSISSMNKQELRQSLEVIQQANITVRNFPLSAEQLRKKLHLKDGGDIYIFATTLASGAHKLFICRKIG